MGCICQRSEAVEESGLRKPVAERGLEMESPLLELDARQVLESLDLNSFENALNVFEQFFSNIQLFCGESNFLKSAHALEIAAMAFTTIDADHDFVMTAGELSTYIAENDNPEIAESLAWLSANFHSLEQLCFFQGGISRLELEAARDVFFGLSYLHQNMDKVSKAVDGGKGRVTDKEVQDYLNAHGEHLDEHHARGLGALVTYLDKLGSARNR